VSNLIKRLGLVYLLLPYMSPVVNKTELVLSILVGRNNYKLKLQNKIIIHLKSTQFTILLSLLGVLTFSTNFIKKDNKIEFTIDTKNKFEIPLENISYEDQNLLELLFGGIKFGANFILANNMDTRKYRDKTIKILQYKDKRIVETSNGIKFYLDSIHPGNTITETFVRSIHWISSYDNWNGKVVVDVGAECGDTPLYFASMGAKVYAFEPIKEYYDAMIRNFNLNPEISSNIVPINAAIGTDDELTFYQSGSNQVGGTSFVRNIHGSTAKTSQAKGYRLESAIEKFGIEQIDLLKMDCKGCESFLTVKSLEKVNKIKIEYSQFDKSHDLQNLLQVLENAGFENILFKHDPISRQSNLLSTTVFGQRIRTV